MRVARAAYGLALCGAAGLWATTATAQGLTLNTGEGGSLSLTVVQLILAITLLSVLPGLAVMVTCFPFVVTVLSILRQAIGLQQAPPNMLIISLALFLTWYVMDPVLMAAWTNGMQPMAAGQLEVAEAIPRMIDPFRQFMLARLDTETFSALASLRGEPPVPSPDAPLSVIVPSFLLTEIQRAFEIGFMVFLPFLIIDLVVSAVLMSMGMMMVPPATVALPFKLAFFVLADGWTLISEALVKSYL